MENTREIFERQGLIIKSISCWIKSEEILSLLMVGLQLLEGVEFEKYLTMQQDFYTKSVFCKITMPVNI